MELFGNWIGLPATPLIHRKFLNAAGEPVKLDIPNHLKTVNTRINMLIKFQYDALDRWQTPQETLALRKGDCEDIVLLKRAVLLGLGYKSEQLVMLIARDLVKWQDHAVLLVLDGQKTFMLDNFHDKVIDASKPNTYLAPIVALSEANSWLFGRRHLQTSEQA